MGKAEAGDETLETSQVRSSRLNGRLEAGRRVGSDFQFAAVAALSGKARKTSLMQAGDTGNSSHHQAGKQLHSNHVPVVKSTRG
jgi:hypothetical protein